jgi:hypothetical protein
VDARFWKRTCGAIALGPGSGRILPGEKREVRLRSRRAETVPEVTLSLVVFADLKVEGRSEESVRTPRR